MSGNASLPRLVLRTFYALCPVGFFLGIVSGAYGLWLMDGGRRSEIGQYWFFGGCVLLFMCVWGVIVANRVLASEAGSSTASS